MNYLRLMIGALLAGVVLIVGEMAFISILGSRILAARDAAGLPPFVPQPLLGLLEVFLTGLFLVWLYAVTRPRFGPGIITAIKAGLTGWFGTVFVGTVHAISDGFGLPATLLLTIALVVMPVFVAATIAGAWIYREPVVS